jgi:hypothetical protein
LSRRQIELSRERRIYDAIRKVVEQISSLHKKYIELSPFLFPVSEGDLDEKYVWLSDLDKMPKSIDNGEVKNVIVRARTLVK